MLIKYCDWTQFLEGHPVTFPIQLIFPPKPRTAPSGAKLEFQAVPVPCCPGGFVHSQCPWGTQGCQAVSLSPVVAELTGVWQLTQLLNLHRLKTPAENCGI